MCGERMGFLRGKFLQVFLLSTLGSHWSLGPTHPTQSGVFSKIAPRSPRHGWRPKVWLGDPAPADAKTCLRKIKSL